MDTGGAVVKIPMLERHVRSLNLSTSVGIGVFEAIRQLDGTGWHRGWWLGQHC